MEIDAQLARPYNKVIRQALASVIEEVRTTPFIFSAKAVISLVGLAAIFPAFIGAWACLKTFQVVPLSDLESSDYSTATGAAQNIGNTGMAVTYMVQLYEFVFHPIAHLFINSYNRRVCREITEVYDRALSENQNFTPDQRAFLVEKKNDRLAHYHGLAEGDCLDLTQIQSQIDEEKRNRLSTVKIFRLLKRQIAVDIENSSYVNTAVKSLFIFIATGLVSLSIPILVIGTYGCYKPFVLQNPFDLASSNQSKVADATANYANTGHALEYLAVAAILSIKVVQYILRDSYHRVKNQQIQESYENALNICNPNPAVRDLFYQRMNQEFVYTV
jgi:hypothetical protein